jgi:hypothetical protein
MAPIPPCPKTGFYLCISNVDIKDDVSSLADELRFSNSSKSASVHYVQDLYFFILFSFGRTGFEFRASFLLGRVSTT